jgi:hypothetical protein
LEMQSEVLVARRKIRQTHLALSETMLCLFDTLQPASNLIRKWLEVRVAFQQATQSAFKTSHQNTLFSFNLQVN